MKVKYFDSPGMELLLWEQVDVITQSWELPLVPSEPEDEDWELPLVPPQ